MKKIIHLSIIAAAFLLCFISCKKEGQKLVLQPGGFASPIAASKDSVILTSARNQDTVIHFTWGSASFGKDAQPAITYSLVIDKTSDTTTWAAAKTFLAGVQTYQYTFTGLDLNNLSSQLGLNAGSPDTIAVRVRADVNQFNGAASTAEPTFSNVILIVITPYSPFLYLPGAYQNWDPTTAPIVNPYPGHSGLFEIYENITGTPGAIQYYKYTNSPDWDHTNYGDSGVALNGRTLMTTNGLAGGLSVPDTGYYELWADLNDNTWIAYKTTWGILGDATPGGWNTDTDLAYDPVNKVWTVTCAMIHNGSFKFRANHDWKIDFGIDADGNLQYADNLQLPYDATVQNITVPSDGIYTLTLDLHVSGVHNYSIVKQ
jgi:hypothetical protein